MLRCAGRIIEVGRWGSMPVNCDICGEAALLVKPAVAPNASMLRRSNARDSTVHECKEDPRQRSLFN